MSTGSFRLGLILALEIALDLMAREDAEAMGSIHLHPLWRALWHPIPCQGRSSPQDPSKITTTAWRV